MCWERYYVVAKKIDTVHFSSDSGPWWLKIWGQWITILLYTFSMQHLSKHHWVFCRFLLRICRFLLSMCFYCMCDGWYLYPLLFCWLADLVFSLYRWNSYLTMEWMWMYRHGAPNQKGLPLSTLLLKVATLKSWMNCLIAVQILMLELRVLVAVSEYIY